MTDDSEAVQSRERTLRADEVYDRVARRRSRRSKLSNSIRKVACGLTKLPD
jgi:hypothetical protein